MSDEFSNSDNDDCTKKQDEIKRFKKNQPKLFRTISKRMMIVVVVSISLTLAVLVIYTAFTSTTEIGYGLQPNYKNEDLKGRTIDTWLVWKINPEEQFHIHVKNSSEVTDERMNVIKKVIFSNATIVIGNKIYYKGWSGALQEISKKHTQFSIPIHFHTVMADSGNYDILIKLTNSQNADGYSAYTKSMIDLYNHKILRSEITIYDVNKLDDNLLQIILMHELGHGFGLGHSDDENDIMYPVLGGNEYISECDVSALADLYDGLENNRVICQKQSPPSS